jgi:hypothetical protein
MSRGAPIHPRQRRAAAVAGGPARPHLGPCPAPAPGPTSTRSIKGAQGFEGLWPCYDDKPRPALAPRCPLRTHSPSASSPTPCPVPRGADLASPEPSTPLRFAPGPGACLGRVGVKVTFRAPSWAGGGARGAAGIGAPRSPAPPRPRESDQLSPPPAPRPQRRAPLLLLSPRAAPPAPVAPAATPPARSPESPAPGSQSRPPRTRPARSARLPGKMRLLPEWLLLLFGPWLLRKVRVAVLRRERGGPGREGPRVRGAPCACPATPPAPNVPTLRGVRDADGQTAGFGTGTLPAQVG